MNNKIYILEPISDWGFNDKILVEKFDKIQDGEDVEIYINSPGGSVFTGYSIYNLIQEKSKTNNITIKIVGIAASIASVIAFAGNKTVIAKTASYLIHNPWSIAMGDAEEFKKQGKELDEIKNQIMEVYKRKTKLSEDKLKALMNEDRIMTADEALKNKLVDSIYEPDKEEQNDLDTKNNKQLFSTYKYVALSFRNKNLNNNSGDESMANEDSNTDFGKIINESYKQITDLKIDINAKAEQIAELNRTISDLKVEHEKENSALKAINQKFEKEIDELRKENAKIEVENKINSLIGEGKVIPALKESETEMLMNLRVSNKDAYDKRIDVLEKLPKNAMFDSNFDRTDNQEDGIVLSHESILNNPMADKLLDQKATALSVKKNISYEDAVSEILGGK